MARQLAIFATIALISPAFGSGCRDYPDDGMMDIELQWEVPPSDDAGVSDADAPEPGTFDECARAGVVHCKYVLEDMSACVKYSGGWSCNEIEFGKGIPCDEINSVLNYDPISGGDYRIEIWGTGEDGYESWYAICPDPDKEGSFYIDGAFYVGDELYMDGSDADKPYTCNVSFYPRTKND